MRITVGCSRFEDRRILYYFIKNINKLIGKTTIFY